MRASTLFAITLSLLLGLGAVAGARYAGLFDKKEAPAVVEKPTVIKVLVANSTLYDNIAVTPSMVKVRDQQLVGEQERRYKEDPGKFMARYIPASPAAVNLRIPKKVIAAESVLLDDMFEEAELPPSLQQRLKPGYRAVNVGVSKANSIGGTIRVGEYVDVWLTSKATLGSGKTKQEAIASACIAKGCKVVMKRDTIWPLIKTDPDNKPIPFTLQANPYRAAVIEYADNHGEISLRPAPTPPPEVEAASSFADLNTKEYAAEDDKVSLINKGEYTVGDADLMRIFNLKPPPPPAPVTPPPPPLMTRRVYGTDMAMPALYDPNGGGPLIPVRVPNSGSAEPPAPTGPLSYSFAQPKKKGNEAEECESCGK